MTKRVRYTYYIERLLWNNNFLNIRALLMKNSGSELYGN